MAITKERVEVIASHIQGIRELLSYIGEGELDELIKIGACEEAIGPLLDPTRWRDEDLFEKTTRAKEVLGTIKELKRRLAHEVTKT